MTKFTMFIIFVINSLALFAQSGQDSTVTRLMAINRDIWIPFSEAYAEADAEKYIALHSDDFIRATGGEYGSVFGLSKYAEKTRTGFQRGRDKGFKTKISFAFSERMVSAEFASERGVYHYQSDNGKGENYDGYGTFHVVERLENGHWKILFDYDSNENGTIGKEDFDAAYAINNWNVITQRPANFDLNEVRAYLEQQNRTYGDRFKTNDISWYQSRYTNDACILPEKSPRICGLDGIIGYYFNTGEQKSLGINIKIIEVSGGPEAVLEEGLYEIVDDKGAVLDRGKFIATWVQENSVWKLRREIWTTDISN